jgi:hypothetical protein
VSGLPRALPPTHRPVSVDLVGCCFTCFLADHIATVCKFPSRCLRCHRAGHQTRSCKQPRSSDVAGLLPRQHRLASGKQSRLTSVVVINLKVGNAALAEQRGRRSRSHSSTPPDQDEVPTLEGSPSRHSHPSPPPLPPPLSAGSPPPQTTATISSSRLYRARLPRMWLRRNLLTP